MAVTILLFEFYYLLHHRPKACHSLKLRTYQKLTQLDWDYDLCLGHCVHSHQGLSACHQGLSVCLPPLHTLDQSVISSILFSEQFNYAASAHPLVL